MIFKRNIFGASNVVVNGVAPCPERQLQRSTPRSRPPEPEEPTAIELATNFASAMARWASAGFKTVGAEEYVRRASICDACDFWDANARAGLGKCKAPGCGCTKFKRWLATEKCREGKW